MSLTGSTCGHVAILDLTLAMLDITLHFMYVSWTNTQ